MDNVTVFINPNHSLIQHLLMCDLWGSLQQKHIALEWKRLLVYFIFAAQIEQMCNSED